MRLSFFISRRINFSRKGTFLDVIIRIAIAAITISVAVMVLTTALVDGFKDGISRKIFGFWGHINIAHVAAKSNFDNVPISANADFTRILDTLGRISYYTDEYALHRNKKSLTKGGIAHIQSYVLLPGIIKTKETLEGIVLKGAGKDFNWENFSSYLVEGNLPTFNGDKPSDEILISRTTARRLNISPGEKLIIHFIQEDQQLRRRFTVSGIYNSGLEEYDKKLALADIRKLTQILQWEENMVGGYEVFLDDIRDMDVFDDYIYLELLPTDHYSETIKRKFPQIFDWLELQSINERVILALMILVSIINMVTALLILILERTRMIGILSALGASRISIREVFLIQAGIIVLTGLLLGNVLGLSLCYLQDYFGFIKLDEASYYLSVAPIKIDFYKILLINVSTVAITMVCLLIPSYIISRIDPIRAIRFN